ncbi:hypothetical protein ACFQH0_04500 [Frigoriflavimonas asaccharolytica]
MMFFSCNSQRNIVVNENLKLNAQNVNDLEKVNFEEIRRLNLNINLKEITVLNDFQETLNLYQRLENGKYARSFPITSLQSGEKLIVIKPLLSKEKYGDLEILSIENKEGILNINYKEIENQEYYQNKWSNPILIIKVAENYKKIKLNLK